MAQQPESAERDALELGLQTALGAVLVASQGYDSQAALDAYGRATALCEQLGRPASPPILRGLAIVSIGRGRIRQAHAYGDQLRALAERSQDPVLEVEAYYVHGVTWFWLGHFTASRVHLEESIARYRPQHARTHLALYSQDPKVICLIRLAFDLWCLGYLDQAETAHQEALALAQALSHPLTLGYTLFWSALLHNHRQDFAATRQQAAAVIALGQEVPYWQSFAMVLRGWAIAKQGDFQSGWAEVQAGLAAIQAEQRELFQPYFLALLAELHAQAGRVETGLALLVEALAVVETKGERWCEADLARRQGELYLQLDDVPSAETALLRSLACAQQQQAKSLQLRAAIRLARLWQRQGRGDDARRVLSAACGWFTEGLSLPELVDAHTLLAQL